MAKNLIKASGLLLIINICVKLFGFGREMAIGREFGTSAFADAYFTAFTFPYFFQAVLGYAFVSAVLPVISQYWQEDGDNLRACRLGSTLINITGLGMIVLSLLGILAANALVWITAPGLAEETSLLAADLARIIFPSMAFMSVGLVISAILNSRYRFSAAALAPGLTSLVIIIAALVFAKGNIYVVAWGTLAGFIAGFLLQLLDLPKTGFKYSFAWDIKDAAVKKVMSNIMPIVLGLAVTQIYTIINRIFASYLAEGTISALNYASKLMNFPLGVFVAAIITAAFPALAERALQADKTALTKTVKQGISMILLVAIPSCVGLILLDYDIIRLIYEGNQFTKEGVAITSQALAAMAPGLIFLGLSMLLIRVYYALDDVKTPVVTGLISIAVNIICSLALVGPLQHIGLSLANSLAAAVNALLLLLLLHKKINLFADGYLGKTVWVSLVGAVLMCIPVIIGLQLWPHMSTKTGLAAELIVLIVLAAAVYFITLKLLRCPALTDIVKSLRKKNSAE